MADKRESLSEQSKRRTNYLLLVFGIVVFLLFVLAWCRMRPKEEVVDDNTAISFNPGLESINGRNEDGGNVPSFARGDAQLIAVPDEVVMTPNVVIGSEAEAPIMLKAQNAPVILESKKLLEEDAEGFVLSGSCMEKNRLAKDEECIIKVLWTPKKVRNISNVLRIVWREDNPSVYDKSTINISLKAQSTDSKDCTICCEKEEKQPLPEIIGPDGKRKDKMDGTKDPSGVIVRPDGIAITEPDKIPLNLNNELMGTINKKGDVVDDDGKVLGRVWPDNTIIDLTTFSVIGKAIHQTSVMNDHGHVLGKVTTNGKEAVVVDANGKTVGFPRVDGQVVDPDGKPIGLSVLGAQLWIPLGIFWEQFCQMVQF